MRAEVGRTDARKVRPSATNRSRPDQAAMPAQEPITGGAAATRTLLSPRRSRPRSRTARSCPRQRCRTAHPSGPVDGDAPHLAEKQRTPRRPALQVRKRHRQQELALQRRRRVGHPRRSHLPPEALSSLSTLRFQERPLPKLLERFLELLLRVHHDRAVPRHWLLERLPRNQEEADPVFAGLHGDLVAAVEDDQ